ncbi:fluoride efflux transporter FluC [Aestuariimicrobium soli]|uniref:fluoride efflux transporter FluC n=1 Tax=Aestuariimicrobium soli TaxID=2035834 RepID=UPI003EB821CF
MRRGSRPSLSLSSVGTVALGGVAGTAAREGLSLLWPPVDTVAWVVTVINLLGSFALGWLLERLARRPLPGTRTRHARLLAGTGFLGGFTTYSSLAVETADLLAQGRGAMGLGIGIGTVVMGVVAAWLGVVVASGRHPEEGR